MFGEDEPDKGDAFSGCTVGCLVQTAFLIGLVISGFAMGDAAHRGYERILGAAILAGQIGAMVLLGRHYRTSGKTDSLQGVIISAAIGFLLSSTCAGMIVFGT